MVNIASETVVNAAENVVNAAENMTSFLTQGKENKSKNDTAIMKQNANMTKEAMESNT
jgi:hypothetical protein